MTASTKPLSPTKLLAAHVGRKVTDLQTGHLADQPWAKAQAAVLRQGKLTTPGANPSTWETTLGGLPEQLAGKTDTPSNAESAAHAAITLYAIHQQGRTEPMHAPSQRLGRACQRLAHARSHNGEPDTGVMKRLQQLSATQSATMRLDNLRGLITMMRADSITLDYQTLAADLFLLSTPRYRNPVLLGWARDFLTPLSHTSLTNPKKVEGHTS